MIKRRAAGTKNKIFFKDFNYDPAKWAETTSYWRKINDQRYLDSAIIFYPNRIDKSVEDHVLMHEIGHSLGLLHIHDDSIMRASAF